MKPFALFSVMVLLAACENGVAIPDLRATPTPAASAAPVAPTPQPTDKQRFIAAIENNGCVISTSTIGAILTQASINQGQLANLTVELEQEGALMPEGDSAVRLTSARCP